jgi:biotin carboxylase
MTLLVLNRRPLLGQLAHWLQGRPLLVVTDSASFAQTPSVTFDRLETVDDYESEEVERIADALCVEYGVERILSTAEIDVVRAARLRKRHNLPGQSVPSALAYRDKYEMKVYASVGGVDVAPMRRVSSTKELASFAEQNGMPIVAKPLYGGGSVGVQIIANSTELTAFDLQRKTWLAEQFIRGDVCHVDGLTAGGHLLWGVPSRYLHTNLATAAHAAPSISGMLPTEDPLRSRLLDATATLLAALPAPDEVTAFHAEFFQSPADKLVLCEIACRPGGCGITEAIDLTTGINLYQAQLRGQAGLPVPAVCGGPRHGWAWFPPRCGVLTAKPSSVPPGTCRFDWFGKLGHSYPGPRSSTDRIAELIFRIDPERPVVDQLQNVERWWNREVQWSLT